MYGVKPNELLLFFLMHLFRKLVNFYLLVLLTLISISCSYLDAIKKKEEIGSCSLIIDSTNLFNSPGIFTEGSLQLEVLFIRKRNFFKPKKTELNSSLSSLVIKAVVKNEVLEGYSCFPTRENIFKDSIKIKRNAQKVLVLIRNLTSKEDNIIAYKIMNINPSDTNILRIELLGEGIKISKN